MAAPPASSTCTTACAPASPDGRPCPRSGARACRHAGPSGLRDPPGRGDVRNTPGLWRTDRRARRPARSRSCAGRPRGGARSIPAPATRPAPRKAISSSGGRATCSAPATRRSRITTSPAGPATRQRHRKTPPRCRAPTCRCGTPTITPTAASSSFPLEPGPFIIPLALPGDDIEPASFKAFHFSGGQGLYIHPNVWHETIIPLADRMRFFDRQGKVHARVSVDFGREFGVYLSVPLMRT